MVQSGPRQPARLTGTPPTLPPTHTGAGMPGARHPGHPEVRSVAFHVDPYVSTTVELLAGSGAWRLFACSGKLWRRLDGCGARGTIAGCDRGKGRRSIGTERCGGGSPAY